MQRLEACDLNDYELDKSADCSLTNPVGRRNNLFATLLLHCYESSIEHVLLSGGFGTDAIASMLRLFSKHQALADWINERSKISKTRRSPDGKPVDSCQSCPALSLHATVKILCFIFSSNVEEHQGRKMLREQALFLRFLLQTAGWHLESYLTAGTTFASYEASLGQLFFALLKFILSGQELPVAAVDSKKFGAKSNTLLIIECAHLCLQVVDSCWKAELGPLLHDLNFRLTNETAQDRTGAANVQSILECALVNFITDRVPRFREATTLLKLILFLARTVPLGSQHPSLAEFALFEWLQGLCRDQCIDDLAFVKAAFPDLLEASAATTVSLPVHLDMAKDAHAVLRDLNEDVPEDARPMSYASINVKTANAAVTALLAGISATISQVEWLLNRMKLQVKKMQRKLSFLLNMNRRLINRFRSRRT